MTKPKKNLRKKTIIHDLTSTNDERKMNKDGKHG